VAGFSGCSDPSGKLRNGTRSLLLRKPVMLRLRKHSWTIPLQARKYRVKALVGHSRPHLLAVHAVETVGMNAIPRAFARALSPLLDLPVASGIVQINRVTHTGAGGYHRLAFPPVFDGNVTAGDYLLVDDFVGQGGTLANLRGHVETHQGNVLGAITLTGKAYSAKLRLDQTTLDGLREKHGTELERVDFAFLGITFFIS